MQKNIYLTDYEDGLELWRGIDRHISSYNTERLHQSLGYQTHESVYKKAS
ncbi:MAG: hypothetical protein J6W84_04325 [Bacteroidales bacterium]|nr:hypothetical protein [Bacteroidales bacterium]